MTTTSALDILFHHATRNISPHTTLSIARIASLRRESYSEPLVSLAKNIVTTLEAGVWSTVTQEHPCLPPTIQVSRLIEILPIIQEWKTRIPQTVLDMGLHDAVVWEEPLEHIECLVNAGANVDAIGETAYFTPLMIAARKGRTDIIHLLLRAGARKDVEVDGHTAYSLATDPDVKRALL